MHLKLYGIETYIDVHIYYLEICVFLFHRVIQFQNRFHN